jgi:hypothetical protein
MNSRPHTPPPPRPVTALTTAALVTLAALGAALGGSRGARAQTTSACLPSDDTALLLQSYVRELVTTTDPTRAALRAGLGLRATDSTQVTLVADDQTCRDVVQGINTAYKTPNLARQLYVVRAGGAYAAQDPGHPSGEWRPTVVVDSTYHVTGTVLAP